MRDPRDLLRRKAAWVIAALLLLYTVTGFFIVPPVTKHQIVKNVAENLGREVSIEKVRFNPFALSLSLRGLSFKDPDGYEFVGFDEFYVNFQASSLFRWAYTFKEVRLDSLRTHVRLMPDGKASFADIVARLEAQAPARASESQRSAGEKARVPRVLIGDLKLNGARLWATNLTVHEPEVVAFTPLDLELFDFTTIPNKEGNYAIGATGPEGGRWQWKGKVTFDPPSSAGSISLEGGRLDRIWRVAKNRVGFEITEGDFALSVDYSVEVRGDSVEASISNGALTLDRFALREKGREPDLFTLDSLRVTGVRARYPEQDVSIERVVFGGAAVLAWLRPTREINWLSLFPRMPSDSASGGGSDEPLRHARVMDTPPPRPAGVTDTALRGQAGVALGASPDTTLAMQSPLWKIAVAEVVVGGLSLAFTDSTTTPPFSIAIDPLDLTLRGLSSEPGAEFSVDADVTIEKTGRLAVEGAVAALPPHARVKAELSGMPLPIFQPYVTPLANLEITGGTLDASGAIEISEIRPGTAPVIRFEGAAGSKDFVTRDTKRNETLVSWRSLEWFSVERPFSRG